MNAKTNRNLDIYAGSLCIANATLPMFGESRMGKASKEKLVFIFTTTQRN